MTPAEKKLWATLRDRQMFGHKFRRQFPIGSFIVDFCCPARNLVVEIDGDSHALSVNRDAERTKQIEEKGYRVIRFTNSDVHERLKAVTDAVLAACER